MFSDFRSLYQSVAELTFEGKFGTVFDQVVLNFFLSPKTLLIAESAFLAMIRSMFMSIKFFESKHAAWPATTELKLFNFSCNKPVDSSRRFVFLFTIWTVLA